MSGSVGVGCEHTSPVDCEQFPVGGENVPNEHVIDRLPFATYPVPQPSTHELPEAVLLPHPPAVMGNDGVGLAHGLAVHTPAGEPNVPRLHVMAREAEAV